MGATMRVSTSAGVMPGAFRMSFTWVVETSGKASMGSPCSASQPAPTRPSVSTATSRRCASAKAIRRRSIYLPSPPRPSQAPLSAAVPEMATSSPAFRPLRTCQAPLACGPSSTAVGKKPWLLRTNT